MQQQHPHRKPPAEAALPEGFDPVRQSLIYNEMAQMLHNAPPSGPSPANPAKSRSVEGAKSRSVEVVMLQEQARTPAHPKDHQAQDVRPAPPQQDQEPAERLHHLTRHHLPQGARGTAAIAKLGAPDPRAAEAMIRAMGQRDLRAAFQEVYDAPTSSFNNNWLRRKLYEAIGVPNAASKKGRRTRRDTVALQRQARKDAADAAEASAAATLAEFAWGPAVEASDEEGDQEQDDMQQGQQEEEQSEDGMQQRGPEGGEEEEAQQKEQEQEQEEVVTQRQEKEEEKEEQKERQEACEVADPSGHSGPQEGSASA